jgi:hypothetical protein
LILKFDYLILNHPVYSGHFKMIQCSFLVQLKKWEMKTIPGEFACIGTRIWPKRHSQSLFDTTLRDFGGNFIISWIEQRMVETNCQRLTSINNAETRSRLDGSGSRRIGASVIIVKIGATRRTLCVAPKNETCSRSLRRDKRFRFSKQPPILHASATRRRKFAAPTTSPLQIWQEIFVFVPRRHSDTSKQFFSLRHLLIVISDRNYIRK